MGPLRLSVRGKDVALEGEPVASNVLALRGALARRRGAATILEVETQQADDRVLGSVIEAAEGTELQQLVLSDGAQRYEISLHAEAAPTHELIASSEAPKLQLNELEGNTGEWKKLEWPLNAPAVDLPKPICGKTCVILVRHEASGAGRPSLLAMLASLKTLLHGQAAELIVRAPAGTGTPSATMGARTVSGRLPPEVIQRIVRQNFGLFRECYEQGLGRDANLQGRVQVRFVIGRDGKVSSVSDGGSDIPDLAVRDCVIQAFKALQFPPPEGGIVTVVYPILLAPG